MRNHMRFNIKMYYALTVLASIHITKPDYIMYALFLFMSRKNIPQRSLFHSTGDLIKISFKFDLNINLVSDVSHKIWQETTINETVSFRLYFMHFADAFIENYLKSIQSKHFLSVCLFPWNQTHNCGTQIHSWKYLMTNIWVYIKNAGFWLQPWTSFVALLKSLLKGNNDNILFI